MEAKHRSALIGFILLCQGAGFVGALLSNPGVSDWYQNLDKPFFNPPDWLFGPAWLVLYTLMAVAAWRVWKAHGHGALKWFYGQLALNALWTPIFFGMQAPLPGLVVVCAMVLAIVGTMMSFRPLDRTAANLLWPYLAWTLFATALNAAIWWLN